MANNWVNIKLEGVIPTAIQQLANTVDSIASALKTALNIQIAALKIISALATDLLNAEALIIKAAVATIESALKPLLGDAQMHLLVVPFRKQPNYRLDPENWPLALSDSDDGPLEDTEAAKAEATIREKIRQAAFYDGGNQGFLRTVAESLHDEADTNRPDDDEDHAVYGHVWVAGASDIVGILDALLTLEGLFGISLKGNSFAPRTLIRTPQDLKLKAINAPSGKIGTLLEWTNPPAEQLFPEFNDVRMRLHEIAVIRSTDDEIIKAKNWTDVFGDTQPSIFTDDGSDNEATDVQKSDNKKSEVIFQFRYDGTRSTYVDDAELKRDTDYYYAVAYRYSVEMPPGVSVSNATIVDGFSVMDYKLLSSVQTVRFADTVPESTGGVKPDWVATPNVLSMIPDLQFYVVVLQEYLDSMANQALGANAALQSYIEFLEDEIERYEDLVDLISGRIQRLVGLLKTPEAGIFTTSIALDSGGSQEFIRELARRVLDETDTSAPPFHTGTEFVAGLVLLGVAPNFASLTAMKTFIELLFGTASSVKTSFEEALESLEQVVATQTQQFLGDDLQPTTTEPTTTAEYKTFNDAMEGVDADDADANVPFDP
jgi:hypothetical protein